MLKRILAVIAIVATTFAVGALAASAFAHVSNAAGGSVGVLSQATPSGLGHAVGAEH